MEKQDTDGELARLRAELAEALAGKARAEALALDLAAALAKKVNGEGPTRSQPAPTDGDLAPPAFANDATPPPWRQRAWGGATGAAVGNDAQAYRLWAQAVLAADDARTLDDLADRLGVAKRTLQRTREWIKAHDPKLWAKLRAREPGRPGDE